jgi:hypothetical protein
MHYALCTMHALGDGIWHTAYGIRQKAGDRVGEEERKIDIGLFNRFFSSLVVLKRSYLKRE